MPRGGINELHQGTPNALPLQSFCTCCSLLLKYSSPRHTHGLLCSLTQFSAQNSSLGEDFLDYPIPLLLCFIFFNLLHYITYLVVYLSSVHPLDVNSQEGRSFFPVDHNISSTRSVSCKYLLNAKWMNECWVMHKSFLEKVGGGDSGEQVKAWTGITKAKAQWEQES